MKKLEKQDKLYHKYRVALKDYKKSDVHKLLEANAQEAEFPLDEVCKLIESSTCCRILFSPVDAIYNQSLNHSRSVPMFSSGLSGS